MQIKFTKTYSYQTTTTTKQTDPVVVIELIAGRVARCGRDIFGLNKKQVKQ